MCYVRDIWESEIVLSTTLRLNVYFLMWLNVYFLVYFDDDQYYTTENVPVIVFQEKSQDLTHQKLPSVGVQPRRILTEGWSGVPPPQGDIGLRGLTCWSPLISDLVKSSPHSLWRFLQVFYLKILNFQKERTLSRPYWWFMINDKAL